MVFVVNKVTLGPVSPWVLWHPPVLFILRMLHIIASRFWILANIWEPGFYFLAALSVENKLYFWGRGRPNYWFQQAICYFIITNRPLFTGYDNDLHVMHLFWLPKSVRYASVCSLQSAGEAQSGVAGYQSHTRRIRAELLGCGWPERWSRTSSHFRWTISSHAEST
jgi:hypothetical protein